MATAYVIYAAGDESAVKERVLPYLPPNGYSHWLTKQCLDSINLGESAYASEVSKCAAILIILTPALFFASAVMQEIADILAIAPKAVLVQLAAVEPKGRARFPLRLWDLPQLDLSGRQNEDECLLANLLPPITIGQKQPLPRYATLIDWSEDIFHFELKHAAQWHDHRRISSLIAAMGVHMKYQATSYPSFHASEDLSVLRKQREFGSMLHYADVVILSGTRTGNILCQQAQALIEMGQYDRALTTLNEIVGDSDSSTEEVLEARGLIGRTYKQRYLDSPEAEGSHGLLQNAINAYLTEYLDGPARFWHGVNAVSCIIHAHRHNVPGVNVGLAVKVARNIVDGINSLSAEQLAVWDYASKTEALLALEEYEDADKVLGEYINHPNIGAFEVSSTFRQFDQLLELGRSPKGAPLLARLRETMERYRVGMPLSNVGKKNYNEIKAFILRVSEIGWEPKNVPSLTIHSRLGRIISASGPDASIRQLLNDPEVIFIDESRPAGNKECIRSIPYINAIAPYPGIAGPYMEAGDNSLVAIIDDGIDVLHQAFLGADCNSRIIGIWDQTDTVGPAPTGFGFGTFHDAQKIQGYVASATLPPGLSRNDSGHGTHVASIAAGRRVGNFAGGVAPGAKLLIVISGGSGSIGYSASHIDALAFIDKFASSVGMPVVVNVSQGMNAGAHDGKSALEAAFDEFSSSGRKQGRIVVKSAGNERDKNGHARITLANGALEELKWSRKPGADYKERIELWWSSADEIRFRLRQPVTAFRPGVAYDAAENWSEWIGTSAPEHKGTFIGGGPFSLIFTKRHIDNGDSRLLIELGGDTGEPAKGEWLLEIESLNLNEEGIVDAWIERNCGIPTSFTNHMNEEMTLSIPGTAQSVITVGAIDARDPIRVGAFSSYGPTRDGRHDKPLVCAPGINVIAANGGTSDGVRPDQGTSMSAPHVAGAIALVLSKAYKTGDIPSGNQIMSALRQKTKNYTGRWDRGQGYGVIDVAAFLAAF
jgi:endonuclease G